jgi:hypothetical protein
MTKVPRRFPPPWHVDEATESFCIRDAMQALAYPAASLILEADCAQHRHAAGAARRCAEAGISLTLR